MAFRLRDNQTTLTLMNKERPVVRFAYDLSTHSAVRVLELINPEYAPPAMLDRGGRIDRASINRWWHSRTIPASRDQFKDLIARLDVSSALELAEKSFGLSLSDRYWVQDERDPKRWADINFFDNAFTEDLGLITLGQSSSSERVSLFSPNSTAGGNLLKKWTIMDGERVLVKAGGSLFNQEPYNEVVATCLYRRLLGGGREYVPYSLLVRDRKVYSCCPNMLVGDEELVCALDILPRMSGLSARGQADALAARYERLGIPEARTAIDKMLACDFLLANSDRHYRNFGLIRDCETLRYTMVAPLFDSGHSLWCDAQMLELPGDYEYVAKPFGYNGTPSREVPGLIGDLSWFEPDRLEGFCSEAAEILGRNRLMPSARVEQVCAGIERSIEVLTKARTSKA